MEQQRRIKQFVLQNFLFSEDEDALGDADSLIRGGIVDSTGIHELILFLEESYQIAVSPDEMVPANFDFCRANLNELSSSGMSIPSESLKPTARLPGSSSG